MRPTTQQGNSPERLPQILLWGLLGIVLIGVMGLGIWSLIWQNPLAHLLPGISSAALPVYGSVPDFSLIDQNSRPVQKVDLEGKIWIADFIFTQCPDECPLMTAEMARLQSDMAGLQDFRSVSITVDPEQDTPKILSQYAARFYADAERWLFLTGDKRAIHHLARDGFRLGVVDPTAGLQPSGAPAEGFKASHGSFPGDLRPPSVWRLTGAQTMDSWLIAVFPAPAFADHGTSKTPLHSTRFVLVDRRAQIRGYYDSLDQAQLQRLREHLQIIQREG
jgi:protein SCO1